MIMLDSSTLIHYLRGLPVVVQKFQQCSRREVRISSVVAYELAYGALETRSARHRSATSALLEGIVQVPFDGAAAAEAARIREELERQGLTIGPMDLLIAASAASRGAVLVTSNTKEFRRVKHLRAVDWTIRARH